MTARIISLAAVLPLLAAGCMEDHTDAHHTVPLQDATAVNARVVMNNGDLDIVGGCAELLEADLVYPVDDRPRIDYRQSNGLGLLEIVQPNDDNPLTIDHNRWDLQLNDDVELGLFIEMDSGDADLELGSLALSVLDFDMDNGEATFDMSGAPSMDLDARVTVDNGHVRVLIPETVSARITAHVDWGDVEAPLFARNEYGDYVLDGPPGAPELRFDIDVDHGNVDLERAD